MGSGLVRRIVAGGLQAVVFDTDPQQRSALENVAPNQVTAVASLAELVATLPAPRTVWVMVPAGGVTNAVVAELLELLQPGDTLIDGGNTYYRDDLTHAAAATQRGIHFVDVGTSGGVWGATRGFCLMIGGPTEPIAALSSLWDALAPGVSAAPRTTGRRGEPEPAERGWLHCGPAGAGHFVKMVHNGIEYGLMAAYAEGLNVLAHAGEGRSQRSADAQAAPMAHPEYYQYEFDLPAIAELWRRGSVVSSWLLDLTTAALHDSPDLSQFDGQVSDSGEGRWTVTAAVDEGVPAPVLTAALYSRFDSRGRGQFASRVLSAMRRQFGGHGEKRG
jgi:6-phosphogluconate dehydrogenase